VGPAPNHYHCVQVAMKQTGAVRVTDTVTYKHHNQQIPTITPTDRIVEATKNLERTIKQLLPTPPTTLEAINKLREIMTTPPIPQQPQPTVSPPKPNRDTQPQPHSTPAPLHIITQEEEPKHMPIHHNYDTRQCACLVHALINPTMKSFPMPTSSNPGRPTNPITHLQHQCCCIPTNPALQSHHSNTPPATWILKTSI